MVGASWGRLSGQGYSGSPCGGLSKCSGLLILAAQHVSMAQAHFTSTATSPPQSPRALVALLKSLLAKSLSAASFGIAGQRWGVPGDVWMRVSLSGLRGHRSLQFAPPRLDRKILPSRTSHEAGPLRSLLSQDFGIPVHTCATAHDPSCCSAACCLSD